MKCTDTTAAVALRWKFICRLATRREITHSVRMRAGFGGPVRGDRSRH
jgi:hypothetical protein